MLFKFLFFISLSLRAVVSYSGVFGITIQLVDGRYISSQPKNSWNFPDIESLFKIDGRKCDILVSTSVFHFQLFFSEYFLCKWQ